MIHYLRITQINDFIFCPYSIYFHNIYETNYSEEVCHKKWQKAGRTAHKAIDSGTYSSRKNILQGISVYSEKYQLIGKIDIFNMDTGELIERKYSVTALYNGFKYQLYAQYFALSEMGYQVNSMHIYAQKTNKSYPIPIPDNNDVVEFEKILDNIRNFSLSDSFCQNINKCRHCIYNQLCCFYEEE